MNSSGVSEKHAAYIWQSIKNASLTVLVRMAPYQRAKKIKCPAAGSAQWHWSRNYTGTTKWEVNQPQLREPLATFRRVLEFHGTQVEYGYFTFHLVITRAELG